MLTSDNDATIDLPAGPTNGNGIIAIERDMLVTSDVSHSGMKPYCATTSAFFVAEK